MTKGLRCPNCDTTINRKTVHDWIVNKNSPHLNCANVFCNTRWARAVLEANAAHFAGEVSVLPPPLEKAEPPHVKTPAPPPLPGLPKVSVPSKADWLQRVREVALSHAKAKGVVTIDDLRRWADAHDDQPKSPSGWGPVFQAEGWEAVSEQRSTYSSNKSRMVKVWAIAAPAMA